MPEEGRRRVVVEAVSPAVDGGRFPAKRCLGDEVVVEADIFCDGHDALGAVLRVRREPEPEWHESPMTEQVNDRWRGSFRAAAPGRYRFALVAWVDHFRTWRRDMTAWVQAGVDVTVELRIGAALVAEAAARAGAGAGSGRTEAARLAELAAALEAGGPSAVDVAVSDELLELMERYPDRSLATEHDPGYVVVVDPVLARFGAWYELFPRSAAMERGRPGTLADVEARLAEIAAMGFDVLYLPPIHPIGRARRKGPNNTPVEGGAESAEVVGSPWAIGSAEGGHMAVDPALGGLEDLRRLVSVAREQHGMEVALDLAYQVAPDHPYVAEHPEWFRMRPDGTIQYAENPPKKYQDIYPFDFETPAWAELWQELKRVVDFWIAQGVRVFRVDNPHTKPFAFWEWLIGEVKREHPEVLLLAEAFTRPKVMHRLAKLGFSQSYTYFAWRNTKWELEQYLTELTSPAQLEYFRPNFWPNTPDILTEYLQMGGRPAFIIRLVLAATLSSSYGIYGPAFELLESRPLQPGSEEYLDSEKYQIRDWDRDAPGNLRDVIGRINRIRRENPALQANASLRFHAVDNEKLIAYSKIGPGGAAVLVVVNLDPGHTQSGMVELPLEALGIAEDQPFQVHDLLGGGRFQWQGARNYVELDPHALPAHVFRVRRRIRTEKDFEYFA